MRTIYKTALLVAGVSATLNASGYKIPEQSLSAMALAVANVAAVDGSDASYYNPANMIFMSESRHELELGFSYINLPSMKYKDNAINMKDGKSKVEHFAAPYAHFVIPRFYDNWRFGFSIVAPAGLAKRWDTPAQKASAQKFSMKVVELNPTAAYKITDKLAIGFGARMIYTTGTVASHADTPHGVISRKLNGDSVDFGYNLAISVKPTDALSLAATYRSQVELSVKGKAKLSYPGQYYDGKASVSVTLPATLNLAAAYTFQATTLEFVYERIYWSKYKYLDFDYTYAIPGGMGRVFDDKIHKNWKDSNTYRLGLTHWFNDNLKLMAGFALDRTPAPKSTVGYELPDSNSRLYSAGFEYKINKDMSAGFAYLYSDKAKIRTNNSIMNGEITNGKAHLATFSLKYRF